MKRERELSVDYRRSVFDFRSFYSREMLPMDDLGRFLFLKDRFFPDGSRRLSFLLQGVWLAVWCKEGFDCWSIRILEFLRKQPNSFFEEPLSVKKMIGDHFCEFPLYNAIFVDVSQIRNVVGLCFSARIRLVEDIVVDAAHRFDLDLKVSRRLSDILGAESDDEFVERLRLGLIVDYDCPTSAAERWCRIEKIFAPAAPVLSGRDLEADLFDPRYLDYDSFRQLSAGRRF